MSDTLGWEGNSASWRDYMDDQAEAAQQRAYKAPCRLPAMIRRRRVAAPKTTTTGDLAAVWGISETMVKRLCSEGRIVGARRSRKGKGRPWTIPLPVQLVPGKRGPRSRFAPELPF